MTTAAVDIDLTDVDLFLRGEHHEAFKTLRRESPVHWNELSWEAGGFWNITKYEDVIHVGVDPTTFISGQGIILDNDGKRTMRERNLEGTTGGGIGYMDPRGNMMIMTDPPRHTVLRQIVNKGFTHKSVRAMEPHLRGLVTRIIDDVIEKGECDFVMDISRRLPLEVICEMVGVPEGDWEAMFELTNRALGFDDPEFAVNETEITAEDIQRTMELFQYMGELIDQRRKDPREDVLTVLVHTEVDGVTLNNGEIFQMFLLLILAGNETTRNASSGGMLALMDNPDQRQKLHENPSIMPMAIEEIVRWTSPVMHFERFVTKDTEIRGQSIAKGDKVVLWYPSANRDEDVFGDTGDTFIVDRKPNEHIAFGKGEHFCLGANLARFELRVLFEELMRRIPVMELAGEPQRLRSNFLAGIKRMPVRFAPGPRAA
ncbi:MAG TPA: cytochrome P450 [Actinomycetota bacterium]|jgi:cytochrome P450|nr:cytochrome P450 [Actinomycetota bacterium]